MIAAVPAKLEGPILIEEPPAPKPVQVAQSTLPPAAAPLAPEPEPKKLPKTGSPFPMMGLLGLSLSLAGLGIGLARKR